MSELLDSNYKTIALVTSGAVLSATMLTGCAADDSSRDQQPAVHSTNVAPLVSPSSEQLAAIDTKFRLGRTGLEGYNAMIDGERNLQSDLAATFISKEDKDDLRSEPAAKGPHNAWPFAPLPNGQSIRYYDEGYGFKMTPYSTLTASYLKIVSGDFSNGDLTTYVLKNQTDYFADGNASPHDIRGMLKDSNTKLERYKSDGNPNHFDEITTEDCFFDVERTDDKFKVTQESEADDCKHVLATDSPTRFMRTLFKNTQLVIFG